jgi:pilus assembly protein CpaF
LLNDPTITEIMVNGPQQIYVERNGEIIKSDIQFDDEDHILMVLEGIIRPLGLRLDTDFPTIDVRLPDGSRMHAVVRPVSVDGPTITIRKFPREFLTMDQIVGMGTMTEFVAQFLKSCVLARLNLLISGGTGSGKTTLLNVLASFIPMSDRIITIENISQLRLNQTNLVRLETKPSGADGKGGITARGLVQNSMKMRPDRIIMGEVRGNEVLDLLEAMNTGHDGSMTTIQANNPRQALSRFESMALLGNNEVSPQVVREQIASSVDLIIHQTRMQDGTRKVTQITELAGMEGDTFVVTDIFKYKQHSIDADGLIVGELKSTGIRPLFTPRLEAEGFDFAQENTDAHLSEVLSDMSDSNHEDTE